MTHDTDELSNLVWPALIHIDDLVFRHKKTTSLSFGGFLIGLTVGAIYFALQYSIRLTMRISIILSTDRTIVPGDHNRSIFPKQVGLFVDTVFALTIRIVAKFRAKTRRTTYALSRMILFMQNHHSLQ